MPYALFEKEAKLSRAFPTATDVWRCAEGCGLVVDGADGKPRLEDDSRGRLSRTTKASSRARRTRARTRNWARTGACKKPDLRRNETDTPELSRQVQQP